MNAETKFVAAAAARDLTTDSWKKRRRIMHWTLGFIGASVAYLILFAPDDGLRQNLGVALVGAGAAIIGSYVFGAVWDDNNKRAMLTNVANPPPQEE